MLCCRNTAAIQPYVDSYSIFYDIDDLIVSFQDFTCGFLAGSHKRFTNDVYTHYILYKANAEGLMAHYAKTQNTEYAKQYQQYFNRLDIAFRIELSLLHKQGQLIVDPKLLILITDITLDALNISL